MSRRKILFVSEFFPPEGERNQTGGTISNRNLIRFLAQEYDVNVLTFDPTSKPHLFCSEPYKVIQKVRPAWRAAGLFLFWQDFVRKCTKDLAGGANEPDFLIATTSTLAAFDVAPPQARCLAVVQAFENFGLNCRWVPPRSRVDLFKGAVLRRFQDGRLMRRADGVLTNSNFMRAAIARRFRIEPGRIHVLKQQVDCEPATRRPPQKTIGFVHRGKDKNIALVLEIARRSPDLTFLVYGHSAEIPDGRPANVSIMGWQSDRSAMFASAAVWLVPSLWAEPFGRVSIEAQAADRAVLVANCGGLPETIFDHRFLIDGYDPEAWLSRIRQILDLPETEIAAAGQLAREAFSKRAHDEAILTSMASITRTVRKTK